METATVYEYLIMHVNELKAEINTLRRRIEILEHKHCNIK